MRGRLLAKCRSTWLESTPFARILMMVLSCTWARRSWLTTKGCTEPSTSAALSSSTRASTMSPSLASRMVVASIRMLRTGALIPTMCTGGQRVCQRRLRRARRVPRDSMVCGLPRFPMDPSLAVGPRAIVLWQISRARIWGSRTTCAGSAPSFQTVASSFTVRMVCDSMALLLMTIRTVWEPIRPRISACLPSMATRAQSPSMLPRQAMAELEAASPTRCTGLAIAAKTTHLTKHVARILCHLTRDLIGTSSRKATAAVVMVTQIAFCQRSTAGGIPWA
mmetsp:Transcript_24046/g.38702  ORF Transcript_24046/g.38702 Transcript_24046/m.38702 type:complete len:279 (+) Transcript_24046:3836-4672(+)